MVVVTRTGCQLNGHLYPLSRFYNPHCRFNPVVLGGRCLHFVRHTSLPVVRHPDHLGLGLAVGLLDREGQRVLGPGGGGGG